MKNNSTVINRMSDLKIPDVIKDEVKQSQGKSELTGSPSQTLEQLRIHRSLLELNSATLSLKFTLGEKVSSITAEEVSSEIAYWKNSSIPLSSHEWFLVLHLEEYKIDEVLQMKLRVLSIFRMKMVEMKFYRDSISLQQQGSYCFSMARWFEFDRYWCHRVPAWVHIPNLPWNIGFLKLLASWLAN